MGKRIHGHPRTTLDERTARAGAEGTTSVVLGPCVGPEGSARASRSRYRGVAYQAVQQLRCAQCGGAIVPGGLFTRRGLRWGSGLHPICRRCAPFELAAS